MASLGSLEFDEMMFADAIKVACTFLSIERFYEDQEEALRQIFKGKDLFFSAHTGYGKSLIFQAIPVIADVMKDNNIGTSTVLVITPLNSLMKDQVSHINKVFGISAAAIFEGQEEDIFTEVSGIDIAKLHSETLCNLLLYGSPNMNMIDNRITIEATIEYIEKTNRLN